MKTRSLFLLTGLTVGTALLLAATWEFGLEAYVYSTLFSGYVENAAGAQWELIVLSSLFAGLATIVPLQASRRSLARRRLAEAALSASEQRVRAIADALPSRIAYIDRERRYRFNNRTYESVYGLTPEQLYGRALRDVLGDAAYAEVEGYIDQALAGEPVRFEFRQEVGGKTRFYDIIYVPDPDRNGAIRGFYALINDITKRKRTEEDLFNEKERAQVTLDSIGDAVITTDPCGVIEYLNPIAEKLTGWPKDEATGQHLDAVFRMIREDDRSSVPDPVASCLAKGHGVELDGQSLLLHRNGHEYAIQATAAPIRGREGRILGAVLVFHDVTEMRQMARRLAHDATHDPLTGLINRREFERRLERLVVSARNEGLHHALCYLDLDLFKLVNDTAGHCAGDAFLKQVKGLLAGKHREQDTLARLGGDEFALLLADCPLPEAQRICEAIVATLRDFRFYWQDQAFQVGVSVGLVPITPDARDSTSLLSEADVACYTAKERGRGRVHVYRRDGTAPQRRHSEILLASQLREALEQGRFQLYYQPIVALSPVSAPPRRFELLLRLLDRQGQLMLPAAFMPAAERYGLMRLIDRWVITAALRWCEEHLDEASDVEIAINLSSCSLNDDTFPGFLSASLAASEVPPQGICLEIAETAALHDLHHVAEFVLDLKRCGCRLAVDDFGSGRTCFSYLKMLPADYLKIDGGLVEDMVSSRIDHAMVAAINEIGHDMGMQTIGEYAHSAAVLGRLRDLGVDAAQGYALGLPRPLEDLAATLAAPTQQRLRRVAT